jgi:hypothetical protein
VSTDLQEIPLKQHLGAAALMLAGLVAVCLMTAAGTGNMHWPSSTSTAHHSTQTQTEENPK